MEARSTAPNQTPQERYSAQLPARRAACRTFGDRNLAKITSSIRKTRTYRIPLTNILHLCCETELTSFALIHLPSSSFPMGPVCLRPRFLLVSKTPSVLSDHSPSEHWKRTVATSKQASRSRNSASDNLSRLVGA